VTDEQLAVIERYPAGDAVRVLVAEVRRLREESHCLTQALAEAARDRDRKCEAMLEMQREIARMREALMEAAECVGELAERCALAATRFGHIPAGDAARLAAHYAFAILGRDAAPTDQRSQPEDSV
jgi:predicted RNase H-like nuclease (RuvC/YqgF family)